MAEHPNAILIRQFYATFSESDYVEKLKEIVAQEAVWHLPGRHPASGEHRGRDAVLAAMHYFDGSVALELHDVTASDDHAVALLLATGDRKGRRYRAREVDTFHIRGGKIVEFWSFSEDQRLTDEYWA